MTFQADLDNIEKKTGASPEQFWRLAEAKGFSAAVGFAPGIKTGPIRRLAEG